jgi:hypothetical protein
VSCYGKQKTLEDIRNEKAEQFKRLKNKRKTREFSKWFLRYNPEDNPINKPYIEKNKPKKTNEDIINEAKLAFEAKVIASNAVINQIDKIQKKSSASVSKRNDKKQTRKNTKNTAKSYMDTIPVMTEPFMNTKNMKSKNNKTMRNRIDIDVKSNKNITDKDVDNILYIKDIITPSSLSASSSSIPDRDRDSVILVE